MVGRTSNYEISLVRFKFTASSMCDKNNKGNKRNTLTQRHTHTNTHTHTHTHTHTYIFLKILKDLVPLIIIILHNSKVDSALAFQNIAFFST